MLKLGFPQILEEVVVGYHRFEKADVFEWVNFHSEELERNAEIIDCCYYYKRNE